MEADLSFTLLESSNFFNNYFTVTTDEQSSSHNNNHNTETLIPGSDVMTIESFSEINKTFEKISKQTIHSCKSLEYNLNPPVNDNLHNSATNLTKNSKSNKTKAKKSNDAANRVKQKSSRIKTKKSSSSNQSMDQEKVNNTSEETNVKKRIHRYCPAETKLDFFLECEWKDCDGCYNDIASFFSHIEQHIVRNLLLRRI